VAKVTASPNIVHVGTVADGSTDHLVVFKLATILLTVPGSTIRTEHVELSQSLVDPMGRFRANLKTATATGFADKPIGKLGDDMLDVLISAFGEFSNRTARAIGCHDVLILNTDAELRISPEDKYFDPWAQAITKVALTAVERFYHRKCREGYEFDHLPHIVPLILFPSTEVLVAAARLTLPQRFEIRGHTAKELKEKLYGTTELFRISPDQFDELALSYLTHERCRNVFRYLPEARLFFRSLCVNG